VTLWASPNSATGSPQIDYTRFGYWALPLTILFIIVALGVTVGLAHTGPQFWDAAATARAWIVSIAVVIGFIAPMTKYQDLARAILAFSVLLGAIGWLCRDDRDDRRRYY
jgi:hypothetical protein